MFGLNYYGGYGSDYGSDGGDYRWSSGETMSKATKRKLEEAKQSFLKFLETADIPVGSDRLQAEVIRHHITGPAYKELNKCVKSHGCTARQRQLSDAEKAVQKGSERTKKSIPKWTSFTVTRAAQDKYRQELAEKAKDSGGGGGGKRAAGGAAAEDQPMAKAARA